LYSFCIVGVSPLMVLSSISTALGAAFYSAPKSSDFVFRFVR
jgi:hypothetical protein